MKDVCTATESDVLRNPLAVSRPSSEASSEHLKRKRQGLGGGGATAGERALALPLSPPPPGGSEEQVVTRRLTATQLAVRTSKSFFRGLCDSLIRGGKWRSSVSEELLVMPKLQRAELPVHGGRPAVSCALDGPSLVERRCHKC